MSLDVLFYTLVSLQALAASSLAGNVPFAYSCIHSFQLAKYCENRRILKKNKDYFGRLFDANSTFNNPKILETDW